MLSAGCGGVYLAEAAFAQHHEEVEVVDSHFDLSGAHVVDGGTGQDGGRGHDCGVGLGQGNGHRLRQGGCCAVRLRLLEDCTEGGGLIEE